MYRAAKSPGPITKLNSLRKTNVHESSGSTTGKLSLELRDNYYLKPPKTRNYMSFSRHAALQSIASQDLPLGKTNSSNSRKSYKGY